MNEEEARATETTTRKAVVCVIVFAVTLFTVTYMSKHEVLLLAHGYLGVVSIVSAFIAFGCWAWFLSLLTSREPHRETMFFERFLKQILGTAITQARAFNLIFSIVLFCIVGAISIHLGLTL